MIYNKNRMDNIVFNFIYGCALHDAILQKSYNSTDKKWIRDVSCAQALVRNYIDCILRGDYKDQNAKGDHDKFFISTASAICQVINGEEKNKGFKPIFSFGNAQKLINMTVKHVYAHTFSNPTLDRDCFRHCHCPMDSIMLDKIWKKYKDTFKNTKALGKSDEFHEAWGTEGGIGPFTALPQRYTAFQKAILDIIEVNNGNIFPIEYDYIFW